MSTLQNFLWASLFLRIYNSCTIQAWPAVFFSHFSYLPIMCRSFLSQIMSLSGLDGRRFTSALYTVYRSSRTSWSIHLRLRRWASQDRSTCPTARHAACRTTRTQAEPRAARPPIDKESASTTCSTARRAVFTIHTSTFVFFEMKTCAGLFSYNIRYVFCENSQNSKLCRLLCSRL